LVGVSARARAPCLARDHSFRPRTAGIGRWRENRQMGVAAGESIEAVLPIPYGCEFTALKVRRSPMLGRRPVGVDNADARAKLERRDEIVEQTIGLGDLVIHVYQDRKVDRISR
jgi:hypothetical protein